MYDRQKYTKLPKILNIINCTICMNYEEVELMPTNKPRFTVIVDEELLKKIDDFRFENRYPSRSAATSELIRTGIETLEKEQREVRGKNE